MNIRTGFLIGGIGLALVVGQKGTSFPMAPAEPEVVSQILRETTVIDTAVTTRFFQFEGESRKVLNPEGLVQGGMNAVVLGAGALAEEIEVQNVGPYVYQPPNPGVAAFRTVFPGHSVVKRMLWEFDAVFETVARHRKTLEIALDADAISESKKRGKLALILGLDSGVEIDDDLRVLRGYYRLGARKLALVHQAPTAWSDSCTGILDDGDLGLSAFGKEVIRECNRLGILVDVSHTSDQTFWETIETSQKPIIASHSGARAITDVARNLTDSMLKALAKNGGMVGVGAYLNRAQIKSLDATGYYERRFQIANHLANRYSDPFRLAAALREPLEQEQARKELGQSDSDRVDTSLNFSGDIGSLVTETVNHLDHIVPLIGEDFVGVGTDVDMRLPGYESLFRELTRTLLKRGYRREAIQKILGGNFVRVFRAQKS
jgi:membrane dipeptidase